MTQVSPDMVERAGSEETPLTKHASGVAEASSPGLADAARSAYQALFAPEECDAFYNLQGALIDIKRLSEEGKPTDAVCIRTIERVLDQLNAAYVALGACEP